MSYDCSLEAYRFAGLEHGVYVVELDVEVNCAGVVHRAFRYYNRLYCVLVVENLGIGCVVEVIGAIAVLAREFLKVAPVARSLKVV